MESYFDDLRKLQSAYARLLEPVCKRWELTRCELDVLLFLYNNPGLDRAADIVTRRGIAKSHASQSIASLERRGLLVRRTDPADRRTIRLKLTEAALPAAREGKSAQQHLAELLMTGLTPEQLELLARLGGQIRENIKQLEE